MHRGINLLGGNSGADVRIGINAKHGKRAFREILANRHLESNSVLAIVILTVETSSHAGATAVEFVLICCIGKGKYPLLVDPECGNRLNPLGSGAGGSTATIAASISGGDIGHGTNGNGNGIGHVNT